MIALRRAHATLLALAVLAAAALGYGAWRYVAGPSVPAYAVERADLVQTVVASGRVETPRRVQIGSSVTGTVASIPVSEGQSVKAGQLLVALDTTEAKAAVDQAGYAVAQATAKIAQLRATALPVAVEAARQADVNLANTERSLERSKELFAKGFIGQAALDESQRARDVAASQLAAARLQRDSEQPGGSDYVLAEAALQQAKANLRAAQAKLEFMTLEAPVAGTLISRDVEEGNVVQPGKTLMTLSPAGATQLVVQIDEKNLNLLRLGQPALASADAYPGRRFAARVAYINPSVDPMRGSVEVKLDVPEPPPYLLQDMTVSVDVEVARRSNVATLPSDAIHDNEWVLVARDGRAVRQSVTLGARGAGRVEIVAGLREGELVVPGAEARIHEGAAVRAARAATRRS
ncbi:MAG: efflux RND transporter periplasmic adaptor subunit [Usitatibacter sp.]